MENKIIKENKVQSKIYTIRGYQVMLDSDLAELYGVETKRLNEAVKRNKERFPDGFCFQMKYPEVAEQRSQIATLKNRKQMQSKYLPYAFTEQGVAMLSAVLKSKTAIKVSVEIMNAFVSMNNINLLN